MNTQDEIKELKQRIAKLEEQVKKEQEFLQEGDFYWLIEEPTEVMRCIWHGDDYDNKHLSVGNVFKTKEQAEFAVEKLKVEAELRRFGRPFGYDQTNCNIILSDNESVGTAYWHEIQCQGSIYFESEEKAQQAIESVGEDRIKKYIFGVEG